MGFLRRLLLGDGRLPDDLRAQLTGENLLLVEEGLTGTLTFRDYRAPGRRSSLEKVMIGGAVAISGRRVVVWIGGGKPALKGKHMDVSFDDSRINGIEVVAESPEKFRLAYDPHEFRPDTSGRVELRFKTPKAAEIVALVSR